MNLQGFDALTVDPRSFEPLPAGNYVVVVTKSEEKDTKAKDGQYLELELEVIDGECKGRKVWDRLTLKHANATAVKIAQARLSSLCRACGVLQPKDSTELHNLPVIAKVKLKKRQDTDELANQIAGYAAREPATTAVKPLQATTDTPPWRRSA